MEGKSGLQEVKDRRGIRLYAIAAMDSHGCIGKGNSLPWRLPSDLKKFKKFTMGSTVIVGRNTYESIGRPLPGRRMVVVTTDSSYKADGCFVANSMVEALELCPEDQVSWVIGGSNIYAQLIDLCEVAHITQVCTTIENGDAFFPLVDQSLGWGRVSNGAEFYKNEGDEYSMSDDIWMQLSLFETCGYDLYGKKTS